MRMDIDWIRAYCLALPHTTEDIQWGNDLLFRVGRKIYASVCLDPASPARLSFKCTPEEFAVLIEQEGIFPAAYVARYHWVSLERLDALPREELKRRVRDSYEMVLVRLPKTVKERLGSGKKKPARRSKKS
jgi:predicted DNA-binding protein (MmcQ/YjbR family)